MLSLLQTDSACAAPKCSLGRMDGLSQSPLGTLKGSCFWTTLHLRSWSPVKVGGPLYGADVLGPKKAAPLTHHLRCTARTYLK